MHAAKSSDELPRTSSKREAPSQEEHANDLVRREGRKIYVGNLSPKVTEYQLVKLFSQYGDILQEDFMWHRDGPKKGQPRGFAFVEYKTRGEAETAIAQLDGKPLLGRAMVVRLAEGSKGTREGKKSGAGAADRERQIAAIRKKLRSMDEEAPGGGG